MEVPLLDFLALSESSYCDGFGCLQDWFAVFFYEVSFRLLAFLSGLKVIMILLGVLSCVLWLLLGQWVLMGLLLMSLL